MKNKILLLSLIFLPLIGNAAGVPARFTYQGKALNAAGTAPLLATVSFTLSITDPSGACTLYQESQPNINLIPTNGIFALQVGSAVGAAKRTAGTDPGLSMTQVFANAGTQIVAASGACTSGYTPAANDTRKLHVVITPTSGSPVTVSPDLVVNSVANALVAETLQGVTPNLIPPPGTVLSFAGLTCPNGFLTADGSSVLISSYSNLAAALQLGSVYVWGSADATHFNGPDLRGVFQRGIDNMGTVAGAAGRDPGDGHTNLYVGGNTTGVGSYQSDMYVSHTHGLAGNMWYNSGVVPISNGSQFFMANLGTPSPGQSYATPSGGSESRSRNVALNYCVKY
jgi:hypothetical protein